MILVLVILFAAGYIAGAITVALAVDRPLRELRAERARLRTYISEVHRAAR